MSALIIYKCITISHFVLLEIIHFFFIDCKNITLPVNSTTINKPERCFTSGSQVLDSLSFHEVSKIYVWYSVT